LINDRERKHIMSYSGTTSATISRTLDRHMLGNPHALFNADYITLYYIT